MKKIFSVLLIALLSLGVASCTTQNKQEEQSEEIIGMPNPIINYDTIDEINEKAGVHIVIPSSLSVTDLRYTTIQDETAQVNFVLDGHKWTVRGSKKVDQDISGIHNENNIFNPGEDICIYLTDFYIDRIFTEGIQYTIVMDDANGYDVEKYSNYIFEMENCLKQANDPNGIAGNYADSTSQRATMTIYKFDELYDITVRWPNSASEYKDWYISGTLKDNKISYGGEYISTYTVAEDGNETCTDSTATNNLGYFEIKDGKLYWTGAAESQCKECVFEKLPF